MRVSEASFSAASKLLARRVDIFEFMSLRSSRHFFIAFVVAAVYYTASRKLTALYRNTAIWGPAFGAAVYLFMNFLVLPFSAVPKSPFSLALFLNGVFGHAIFVGFPIAWFAQRSASKN